MESAQEQSTTFLILLGVLRGCMCDFYFFKKY